MRWRKLTSGVRYLRSKSSKDAWSPAFTSIMSWTSDLAIASTLYRTRWEAKSCTGRVLPAAASCVPGEGPGERGGKRRCLRLGGGLETGERVGIRSETFGVGQE